MYEFGKVSAESDDNGLQLDAHLTNLGEHTNSVTFVQRTLVVSRSCQHYPKGLRQTSLAIDTWRKVSCNDSSATLRFSYYVTYALSAITI